MWTVGLIDYLMCCKTYGYNTYEEAKKCFDDWARCFRNNNIVENSTTIIKKDRCEQVETIKTIFTTRDIKYVLFVTKNKQ